MYDTLVIACLVGWMAAVVGWVCCAHYIKAYKDTYRELRLMTAKYWDGREEEVEPCPLRIYYE